MYKEMGYESLSQLVTDYKESYEGWWHTVLKIRLGLALSHDPFSNAAICWRYFCYKVRGLGSDGRCAVGGTQKLLMGIRGLPLIRV